MSKPYDIRYHLAPAGTRAGTMQCGTCRHPIDDETQDFREAKKSKHGDWGYITHHRSCLTDDAGFLAAEEKVRRVAEHQAQLRAAAIAFRDKWEIADLDQLIDELDAALSRATGETGQ